ncbi:hypothetical protein K8I61_11450 [bacterium]|nr:hypothetical protein [bacterium]
MNDENTTPAPESASRSRYADIALAGLVLYAAILLFATLDEYLGWGILSPYF